MCISPHPLALRLIERLHDRPYARILEFASGSGRNERALAAAGFEVVAIGDEAAAQSRPFDGIAAGFAGAISTHGLLHGTPETIAGNLESIAQRLEPQAPLYATLGSVRDPRMGKGAPLGPSTFAPTDGEERGVAHTYFDERAARALLEPHFVIESLQEGPADGKSAVHWFLVALNRLVDG